VGPEAYSNALELALAPPPSAPSSPTDTSTTSPITYEITPSAPPAPPKVADVARPAPGYPSPVFRQKNNYSSGYFISEADYDDLAILVLPTFGDYSSGVGYQKSNTEFIAAALAENKTKLIIDVSGDGGGTILQGHDLFKQLFPSMLSYGATRFRAHEASDVADQEPSEVAGHYPRSMSQPPEIRGTLSSVWNYRTDFDVNYEPFTSWDDKYGPYALGPSKDTFTYLIRYNMSDVLDPDVSGIYVSGYNDRANLSSSQPFESEDIIIVHDEYCASSCTIFSELMLQQGGVKSVALGGRPNTDSIQAVGGVKGTQLLHIELPPRSS
jgi:hypothetical protein